MQVLEKVGRRIIAGRSVRWDAELAETAYAQGYWIHETLGDALVRAATQHPQRTLIVDGDIRLDAGSLYEKASALAQAFLQRQPAGSVVSFMLPNWHETAVIYAAATLAGMVVNPILPSLRDHDLGFMLKDVNTRFLFIPAEFRQHDYVAMLERVSAKLDEPPEVIVVRGDQHRLGSQTGFSSYDIFSQPSEAQPLPQVDADAVHMIMYTSGTTGRPKGVMHSHNSIHALIRQIGEHWLTEPGDKFLVASPISHIGGSIYAFECPLLLDATAVLMEHWNPQQAVALLQQERCTHFAGATPFLTQILTAARQADTRLPDLKLFVCGGASVPPSLIHEATAYFEKAAVTRVYGSTEVPVMTVGAVGDVHHAAETDGQPGIARILLRTAPDQNSAEAVAKGPQMLVGYLHPEDEASVFDDEGFFRTGDLARWVDDRYLMIVGRAKDIIIRHGENIAPKEIEDLLIGHPDIAEVAIVGLPDPKTGERACAVVVAKSASQPTLADLSGYLMDKGVAKFKLPEQLAVWEALPKNDAGKILKHKIRALLDSADRIT